MELKALMGNRGVATRLRVYAVMSQRSQRMAWSCAKGARRSEARGVAWHKHDPAEQPCGKPSSSSTLPAFLAAFSKSLLRSHVQLSLSALLSGGHLPEEQRPPPIMEVSRTSRQIAYSGWFSSLDWVSGTPFEAVVAEDAQE